MREIIADLVRQTKDLFDVVKVSSNAERTLVQAVDKEKLLILNALLHEPQPELHGEFGLASLKLLDGLLEVPGYRTASSAFRVRREAKNGAETVTALVFEDAFGTGATYKTMAAHLAGDQTEAADIPWTLSVVPSKAKVAEFQQLSRLYAEFERFFTVAVTGGNLVFSLGDDRSSMHSANMVFAADVGRDMAGSRMRFDVGQFLSVMRVAGAHPVRLAVCDQGVLGIGVQAPTGHYQYYLRAKT